MDDIIKSAEDDLFAIQGELINATAHLVMIRQHINALPDHLELNHVAMSYNTILEQLRDLGNACFLLLENISIDAGS